MSAVRGVGVVGTGIIYERHARACEALADRARLAAVADVDGERLAAALESFPQAAGCRDHRELIARHDVDIVVVCTPPSGAGMIAAAAEALGLHDVWAIGGAQTIGWLAYVERVDKIVGPGNQYVNEAKLEVSRDVPIDLPGGPSEVVVLGGTDEDKRIVELELAAQREHGHDAICTTVDTLEEAEAIAPEHLVLLGDAERLADQVKNAGSVFVGRWSPVPAGDYATGGNHVLPTNGWARSVGGLGLETFLKPVTVQRLTEDGMRLIKPTVDALAEVEGLPEHAKALDR